MSKGRWIAFAFALTMFVVGALGMGAAIKVFKMHLSKLPVYAPGGRVLSSLPRETTKWTAFGSDRVESADVVETLGTENYLNRNYVERDPADPNNPVVLDLHIAYYTGMIDLVPHVPERCFVGGGMVQSEFAQIVPVPMDTSAWRVDDTVPPELCGDAGVLYTARIPYDFGSIPGKRVRLPRDVTPEHPIQMRASSYTQSGGRKLYAGYFFIANGGTVANANAVRTLAYDLTSDYAFYLKVQVTSASVVSFEDLAGKAGSLLEDLLPDIMLCVPDWVEVQQGNYPEDNPRRGKAPDA